MAQYPQKAGYYDRKELMRLSLCIGFPGSFLVDGLRSTHLTSGPDKPVADSAIRQLLQSRYLDNKLEKRFNHYPAHYNQKLFLKVMSLLRHKRLSFSEISSARVAFELYRDEDGAGMQASASVVLQALNMIGRLMSPIRLESEILKQQGTVDSPSRIQMYEFLDLVTRCTLTSIVEKEMASIETSYSPESEELLMTKDERVSAYLDKQYKDSLYKKVTPTAHNGCSSADRVVLASRIQQEKSVTGSRKQLHVLVPALEHSQHQLFKARNGFTVFSMEQLQAAESLHASRLSSRAGMRSNIASRARSDVNFRAGLKSRIGARSKAASRAGMNKEEPEYCPPSPIPKSKSVPILPTLLAQNQSETTAIPGPLSKLSSPSEGILHPVVSEVDVQHHQGLMDELKWEELRQGWQSPAQQLSHFNTNPDTDLEVKL